MKGLLLHITAEYVSVGLPIVKLRLSEACKNPVRQCLSVASVIQVDLAVTRDKYKDEFCPAS